MQSESINQFQMIVSSAYQKRFTSCWSGMRPKVRIFWIVGHTKKNHWFLFGNLGGICYRLYITCHCMCFYSLKVTLSPSLFWIPMSIMKMFGQFMDVIEKGPMLVKAYIKPRSCGRNFNKRMCQMSWRETLRSSCLQLSLMAGIAVE